MTEEDSDADSEGKGLKDRVQEVRELPAGELTELEELSENRPEKCLVCGDEYIHHNQPPMGEMSLLNAETATCITVVEGSLHVFHHSDQDGPESTEAEAFDREYTQAVEGSSKTRATFSATTLENHGSERLGGESERSEFSEGIDELIDEQKDVLDRLADDVESGEHITFEEHVEERFSNDYPLKVLFSSMDRVRVIEVFIKNASRELSTEDIARLSDTKPSVVRSQTGRLCELGIIEAVVGEENTFELNSDDEIAQLLRQLEGVALKRLLDVEK